MTQFLYRGSPLPAYMAYPRFLLTADLNETAALVYTVLLDRARLSMQTEGWQDKEGQVFIYYTTKTLAEAIGKSESTVKTALKTLRKHGLIYCQHQGSSLPSKIYVKVPAEFCPTGQAENYLSGGSDFRRQTGRKLSAINNKSNNRESYIRSYDFEEGESL